MAAPDPERAADRFGDVAFRLVDGLRKGLPLRQARCDGRGIGAARPMGVDRVKPFAGKFAESSAVEQDIDGAAEEFCPPDALP